MKEEPLDFLLHRKACDKDLTNGLLPPYKRSDSSSSEYSTRWKVCCPEWKPTAQSARQTHFHKGFVLNPLQDTLQTTYQMYYMYTYMTWLYFLLPAYSPNYGRLPVSQLAGCESPLLRFHHWRSQRLCQRSWWLRAGGLQLLWSFLVAPDNKNSVLIDPYLLKRPIQVKWYFKLQW